MTQLQAEQFVPLERPRLARWWSALGLAAVLVVCLLIRLWVIDHTQMIARDGTIYIKMAQEWQTKGLGVIDGYDYHVGYPVALLGVHNAMRALGVQETLDSWEQAGEIVSLLSALAAMVAMWLFTARTFNPTVATIGGLLLACSAKWISLGSDVLSDSLAVALQLWSLVFGLWALEHMQARRPLAILTVLGTGLCTGAAYMVRPESLLPLVLVILVWLGYGLRQRRARLVIVGSVILAVGIALACALPYAMAIGGLTKKKHLVDILLMTPGSLFTGILDQRPLVAEAAGVCMEKLMAAAQPVIFSLACLYLLSCLVPRRWIKQVQVLPKAPGGILILSLLIIVPILLVLLYCNVKYLSSRHMLLLAMLLSALAGAMLLMAFKSLGVVMHRPGLVRAIAVAVTVGLMLGLLWQGKRPLHEGKNSYRTAGEFLARQSTADDNLISDNSWILHYSQVRGELKEPQQLNFKWLGDRLTLSPHVTYMAFADAHTETYLPRLSQWLKQRRFIQVYPGDAQSGLAADGIRIYKLMPPLPAPSNHSDMAASAAVK